LGVLGYPGACKQAEARPIIDRIFHCKEGIHTIWLGLDKALQSLEHVDGIGLFLGSGLGPVCSLSEFFPNIRVEMDAILLECSLVNDHTWALCQQAETVGCRSDVIAKSLLANRSLGIGGRGRIPLAYPAKIGTNEVEAKTQGDDASRLLVIPFDAETKIEHVGKSVCFPLIGCQTARVSVFLRPSE
jgi:hypothetical protein